MKCYYLGDKKITEAEAKEIEAKNREILRDGTVEELLQIARQRLAEREKADMKPCYEDVLAEILESGGKLTVYDREDDKDHELTLEKLLNGWKKYAEDHNADDFDEYDGISADCIMQYAIFGDVIYG